MSLIHEFHKVLTTTRKPIIVCFSANWCSPCKVAKRNLQILREKYNQKFELMIIDVDKARELATAYKIRAVPTVLAFRGTQIAGVLQGARQLQDYEELVKRL